VGPTVRGMSRPHHPSGIVAKRTSFGLQAGRYEQARPDWPTSIVRWLLKTEGDGGLRVLDIGCGTGKGTRALVALGHSVVAMDSSRPMIGVMTRSVDGAVLHKRQVLALVARAEDIPLASRSVDAAVAFQAWHWFRRERAAREIARVLREGGQLGLAWQQWDERTAWSRYLTELIGRPPGRPDPRKTAPVHRLIGPAERKVEHYTWRLDIPRLVAYASTWSRVATSPQASGILTNIERVASDVADDNGIVHLPMTVLAYRMARLQPHVRYAHRPT
jgi:SAM-dependent methyltransferase